jgi:hypothetical protein
MMRSIALLLLIAVAMTRIASAQPDRSVALEKAKAKFEKEMAKADEVMLANIDKTIAKAGKMLQEKLMYERPLFASQHLIPTSISADAYLKERTRATKELISVYQPVITDLNKAKKFEEAQAVEDVLNDTLKSARGYGLAIPDIDAHPELVFTIENKGSGMVLDTETETGRGKIVLNPKSFKSRPSQLWKLEREDKGFLIRNVKSKSYLNSPGTIAFGDMIPMASTGNFDQKKETPASYICQLTSMRHEFLIEPLNSESILLPVEKKVKGVTTIYLTQEKKESATSASQLWKLVEVR